VSDASVVGGGISGVACAAALTSYGADVRLLERSHRLAGRMSSPTLRDSGTRFDGRVTDIGASYFTTSDPDFVDVVDRLIARDVVRPWTTSFHVAGPGGIEAVSTGPMRYAAPLGLRSVVEALAEDAGLTDVVLGSEVAAVQVSECGPSIDGQLVEAAAICMPGPQAAAICASLPPTTVTWEPVIAVTCVYDRQRWVDLDGVFVNDDPVLTWIADDGRRRGDGAPVLVAHVNPVLAAFHLADPASVVPLAVAAVRRVLGIDTYPDWVDSHRWTFAKPLSASDEPYWLHDSALLGHAGDAWAGGPRVEAAWLSGRLLGRTLTEGLGAAS